MLGLEALDVVAQLFGELALVRAFLDVRAVEPLDVTSIEHRRPRLDRLQLRLDLFEQRRFEHAGGLRRFVRILLENIPAAEHDIIERRKRHEILDERRAAFGPLPEPDRAHLRQRADWLGEPAPHGEHAGDRRRADGAHANEQNAQFPCRFRDFRRIFHNRELYH